MSATTETTVTGTQTATLCLEKGDPASTDANITSMTRYVDDTIKPAIEDIYRDHIKITGRSSEGRLALRITVEPEPPANIVITENSIGDEELQKKIIHLLSSTSFPDVCQTVEINYPLVFQSKEKILSKDQDPEDSETVNEIAETYKAQTLAQLRYSSDQLKAICQEPRVPVGPKHIGIKSAACFLHDEVNSLIFIRSGPWAETFRSQENDQLAITINKKLSELLTHVRKNLPNPDKALTLFIQFRTDPYSGNAQNVQVISEESFDRKLVRAISIGFNEILNGHLESSYARPVICKIEFSEPGSSPIVTCQDPKK